MSARARTALIVAALAALRGAGRRRRGRLSADEAEAAGRGRRGSRSRGRVPAARALAAASATTPRRASSGVPTALYEAGRRDAGRAHLRPLRLARGEARRRLRGVAGERGPDRAARRALPAQRARPAPRRARALLGGHRRRAHRLARGARRRARHAVRRPRGRPDPPEARARAARLHAELRLPDRGRDAGRAARAAPRPTRACAAASSTGSRCSGSAGRSRRGAPSPRRCELAPNGVDALVADAVGRYEKSDPSGGVLAARAAHAAAFPEAATVRFHLGLLLLWQGDVEEATRQLASSEKGRARQPDRPGSRTLPRRISPRRDRLGAR